jgi:hypothetical protein
LTDFIDYEETDIAARQLRQRQLFQIFEIDSISADPVAAFKTDPRKFTAPPVKRNNVEPNAFACRIPHLGCREPGEG